MKAPARFLGANLIWSRTGPVWAVFAVEASSYPWLPRRDKLRLHAATQAALRSLDRESVILSTCTPAPNGVEGGPSGATERRWFLAAALPPSVESNSLRSVLGAASAAVVPAFGLAPAPVGPDERARRARQAQEVLARLEACVPVRPASVGEVCWLYDAALRRGLPVGPPGPPPGGGRGGTEEAGDPRLITVADAVFKEGGFAADPDRPRHRRYLRVETESGVCFQALLAISGLPERFSFPDGGGEWLAAADAASCPVDWCLRIRPIPPATAQASARRQARQLHAQAGEYEGDSAGAPPSLAEAIDAIGDLRTRLGAGDTELQVTIVLALGAPDLRRLEERVAGLRSLFGAGYSLHRPIGGQSGLFLAMLPGAPARAPVGDYRHHLLSRDLAAGMPFAGAGAGDPQGFVVGDCADAGTTRPVLLDPAYGPSTNRSGSLGVFGALGSGKSYFMKGVVAGTLERGGRVCVLDRTASGEYARLAGVLPGRSQVLSVSASPPPCLDPLRLFEGPDRVRISTGFLTMLAGATPTDPAGLAIAEAVRRAAANQGGRLSDVAGLLAEAAQDPGAGLARRAIEAGLEQPIAAIAFGAGPVARLDADYLVLHVPGLRLPEREIALREHLARRLAPEQVLSCAVLYLLAAAARQVTYADPSRFSAAVFDEAWHLTASLEGRSLLLDGIREGRKHNAAVWLVSQHPNDLGDTELAHLLGPRFVFRQDRGAAPAALQFVGVEPTDQAVDTIASAPEGTCLFRDVRGRVALVRIRGPRSDELRSLFDTNPSRSVRPA